jgi:bacteriorhodopsin
MAAGLVLVLTLGRTVAPERKHHVVVSSFVLAIASLAYFAMANGQGTIDVDGRVVYYARYIDWVFTTPLLLIGLMTVAMPRLQNTGQARDRNALIGTVIGADVLMIVTGAIGAVTVDTTVKYLWYAFGCVAFLVVLYAILVPIRAAARGRGLEHARLYDRLLWTLIVLWFVYPIVWVLGTEGSEVIGLSAEVGIFAIVDLLAKVGFGLLLVGGVARLVTPMPAARTASQGT